MGFLNKIGDLVGSITKPNTNLGTGVTGLKAYEGSSQALWNGLTPTNHEAINSKLFNSLMQWDRETAARVQPFVGGRFILIPAQMPPMMERLHPTACNYMRVLFTSTVIGVDGFEDNQLDTETVQALTEQNSYNVVTKASGSTKTITLTFMTIFQGLPIYRFITTWMNYIQNRGSGVSSYPHLTAATGGAALEYHEGNHSMTFVYIIPDPSMRYVEDGAFIYSAVPTSNVASQILNQEWGSSAPKQYAVPFKVNVITAQHHGVRKTLNACLQKWIENVALDDNQVNIAPLIKL